MTFQNISVKPEKKLRIEQLRLALRIEVQRPVFTDEVLGLLFVVAPGDMSPEQWAKTVARTQPIAQVTE